MPTTINELPVPAQKIDPRCGRPRRTGFRRRSGTAMPEPPRRIALAADPGRNLPAGRAHRRRTSATATPVAWNSAGGNGYGAGALMVAAPAGLPAAAGEGTQGRRRLPGQ